jgi:hypothetical protein
LVGSDYILQGNFSLWIVKLCKDIIDVICRSLENQTENEHGGDQATSEVVTSQQQ